jgi:hypothetical protein
LRIEVGPKSLKNALQEASHGHHPSKKNASASPETKEGAGRPATPAVPAPGRFEKLSASGVGVKHRRTDAGPALSMLESAPSGRSRTFPSAPGRLDTPFGTTYVETTPRALPASNPRRNRLPILSTGPMIADRYSGDGWRSAIGSLSAEPRRRIQSGDRPHLPKLFPVGRIRGIVARTQPPDLFLPSRPAALLRC